MFLIWEIFFFFFWYLTKVSWWIKNMWYILLLPYSIFLKTFLATLSGPILSRIQYIFILISNRDKSAFACHVIDTWLQLRLFLEKNTKTDIVQTVSVHIQSHYTKTNICSYILYQLISRKLVVIVIMNGWMQNSCTRI